jgi:chemotaxis protein MotB
MYKYFIGFLTFATIISSTSCVSKKKMTDLQTQYDSMKGQLAECDARAADYMKRFEACEDDNQKLKSKYNSASENVMFRDEQIKGFKEQIVDLKKQRDNQLDRVEDLTVLSTSANENIKQTLNQLERKDKYIQLIQAARTKTDSINLALAVNLKGVLNDGLTDSDVEVKVDKTVVFINLSDKMLYKSGRSTLTSRANEVLGKIASILKSRPGFEVIVEGYTDSDPISSACVKDNWDLSVLRSTSVVRALQNNFGIDPNRLIAAGRGEYNALTSNDTAEGKSMNRRTRIIIMPKLDQFYDLLNPEKAAAGIE